MIKKVILIVLAVMFIGILFNMGMYFFYPDVKKLKKENPDKTTFMKYREDERRERGKNIRFRQHWVRLSRISPYVIKAVIISEDDKFWHHEGFDYEALQQAFEEDIRKGNLKSGKHHKPAARQKSLSFSIKKSHTKNQRSNSHLAD
jgi:monofunctional biosynthetic peptidoglycan transglycosylase